ncbi:MAG: stage II sporulation protein P [Clostridia bacterium]|nr:stage II sporulation protein P [Clostridia bacterium]
MSVHPIKMPEYPTNSERISLEGHYRKKNKFFALFLISCAVLVAGFAITAVFAENGIYWLRFGGEGTEESTSDGESTVSEDANDSDGGSVGAPLEEPIPENAIPVFSTDLSCFDRGKYYMINESVYTPDIDSLLEYDLHASGAEDPLVLILHTHTSEGYLDAVSTYLEEEIGTATYSADESRNVIAVGAVLCDTLNQNGISTIHCKVSHDEGGMSGSYSRAADSIRFFLTHYPSIRYVIDLHRDAILTSEGEYVRAVTTVGGENVAQVMSVVGSSGGGSACDNWQENLALALQLRQALNADGAAICRPVTLRNATYNQEIAPYSLLLEIGTGANTVEEAKRAAAMVGEALARLIRE